MPGCVNFIDGAVLSKTVGGQTAFYETDGLAFRLGGQLRIVEIKSFPKVDGHVDPAALASALDQGALYTLLVEQLLADLGLEPGLVSRRLVLICPRNVAMTPCLSERDVTARMRRIERLLDSVPHAGGQPRRAVRRRQPRVAGAPRPTVLPPWRTSATRSARATATPVSPAGCCGCAASAPTPPGTRAASASAPPASLAGIPACAAPWRWPAGSTPTSSEAGAADALRAAARPA